MGVREQRQATIRSLLDKIIPFNLARHKEYDELCLEIQRDYVISDFIDMFWYMEKCCETLRNNDEPINELSDTDIVTLEQLLKTTADFIGVNTNGINTVTNNTNRANSPVPDYSFFSSQLELLLYFSNIPSRYIKWPEDINTIPFFGFTIEKQMAFLKSKVEEGMKEGGETKGKIAAFLRNLRDYMKLTGLFSLDPTFMNVTLRDFLNLNLDGSERYTWDEVKGDAWREIPSLGSKYHQNTAPNTKIVINGNSVYNRLNAKFCHDDGREAVFTYNKILITEYPDKGTYNYGGNSNSIVDSKSLIKSPDNARKDIILALESFYIPFPIPDTIKIEGRHKIFDMDPYDKLIETKIKNEKDFREKMEKLNRENGGAKDNGIIYGSIYGNSIYWEINFPNKY